MKRGRKSLPTEVKRARGNPGGRASNPNEPKFDVDLGLPRFALGPEAARSYGERRAHLEKARVLEAPDAPALTVLAAWEGYLAAHFDDLEMMPPTQTGAEGGEQVNAEIRAALQISKELRLWYQLFGLTPSSRPGINARPAPAEDDPNSFASRRRAAMQPRSLPLVSGGKK